MLGDGTIESWWRRVWPLGARRNKSPANDALFIDVMADFSRKLSERVARQSAGGLAGAAQERREALKAYDRRRRRQQIMTAGVAVGALIALGIASPDAAHRRACRGAARRRRRPGRTGAACHGGRCPADRPARRDVNRAAGATRSIEHGAAGRARAAAR